MLEGFKIEGDVAIRTDMLHAGTIGFQHPPAPVGCWQFPQKELLGYCIYASARPSLPRRWLVRTLFGLKWVDL